MSLLRFCLPPFNETTYCDSIRDSLFPRSADAETDAWTLETSAGATAVVGRKSAPIYAHHELGRLAVRGRGGTAKSAPATAASAPGGRPDQQCQQVAGTVAAVQKGHAAVRQHFIEFIRLARWRRFQDLRRIVRRNEAAAAADVAEEAPSQSGEQSSAFFANLQKQNEYIDKSKKFPSRPTTVAFKRQLRRRPRCKLRVQCQVRETGPPN